MKVLSEEKLCTYLNRVLDLSHKVLARLPDHGSEPAADDILDEFHALINNLNEERANDPRLSDESWNWIWEGKGTTNHVRLYGRLAWLNMQLLELL